MRSLIVFGTITVILCEYAFAQGATPFIDPVPEATQKSMAGNKLDPMGEWNNSDVELPETTKSLSEGQGASVHNLAIKTPDGLLVLSQLWDASCTTSECPTRIYLVKKDGSREEKLAPTMLPQIVPIDSTLAKTKGLSGAPPIILNPDGKGVTASSEEHGTEKFEFK